MKLLWQALRATTLETLGVVLLVWTILEVPALSYRTIVHTLEARGVERSVAARREPSRARAPWSVVSGPLSMLSGSWSVEQGG